MPHAAYEGWELERSRLPREPDVLELLRETHARLDTADEPETGH